MTRTPIRILLVDDDEADVRLTLEMLRRSKIGNDVHVARDGEEALAFLRQEGDHVAAPRPDLVMLDLNMPGMGGLAALEEMKADPTLRRIPVVVVTTSQAESDITASYDAYANCYVTKPIGLDQFGEVVSAIENFWFEIVQLPDDSG